MCQKVKDPHNIKYRAVNLGNKTIADKLLPASGAFEVRAKLDIFNLERFSSICYWLCQELFTLCHKKPIAVAPICYNTTTLTNKSNTFHMTKHPCFYIESLFGRIFILIVYDPSSKCFCFRCFSPWGSRRTPTSSCCPSPPVFRQWKPF